MGKKHLAYLFEELSECEQLQGNSVLICITKHCKEIDFATREKCFEDILNLYQKDQFGTKKLKMNCSDIPHSDFADSIDFRVNQVELKNIKCYTKGAQEAAFGLSFSCDNTPYSAIVYGTNGVGKSAIFGAMEYVYSGQVSEFSLRNYDQPLNWLSQLASNEVSQMAWAKVITPSGKLGLECDRFSEELDFFAKNHFLNETKVNQNGKVDYSNQGDFSVHRLIASGLGLRDLTDIASVFSKMVVYNRQKEKREYVTANSNITQSIDLIEAWQQRKGEIKTEIEQLRLNKGLDLEASGGAVLSEIIAHILRDRVVLGSSIFELESTMRDFLGVYQLWSDVENGEMIEHRYQMVSHAGHLIESQGGICLCPLCSSPVDAVDLRGDIETRTQCYHAQLSIKAQAQTALNTLYETLDRHVDMCSNFIVMANGVKLKLAGFSELKECVEQLSRIVKMVQGYRDGAYLSHLLTIRNSGDAMKQLNRFLYFELEQLITVSGGVLSRSTAQLEDFYGRLEGLVKNSYGSSGMDVNKKVGILERELDYVASQIEKETIHLSTLNDLAAKAKADYDLQVTVLQQIKQIEPILKKSVNERIVSLFLPIQESVKEMMGNFLEYDNASIDINCESGMIKMSIVTADGFMVSPAVYLNTFRYKLFCLALSISLVLLARKRLRLNLPIVFDDPFLDFDTNQRDGMITFAQKMATIMGRCADDGMPVQVILFTHNWQLFQILKIALQQTAQVKFMILDGVKNCHHNGQYLELARNV